MAVETTTRPGDAPERLGVATRLLAAVSVAHWVSHVHILVLPPLFPLLKDTLGASFVDLGIALTVYAVVSGLTQAPMGVLVDRFGAKRILIAGLCLGGIAFALLGIRLTYPWLIFCSALLGLANAVYHPADYALLAAGIGEKQMGRAFSIHTFAGFLGGAMAPAMILVIVNRLGLSAAFFAAAIIAVVAAALIAVIPTPATGAAARAKAGGKGAEVGSGSLTSVLTPAILTMLAFFVLISLSGAALGTFSVVALMAGYDVDFTTANIALTAYLALGALGVLAGGLLADRTRHHGQVAAACFAANAVLVLLIALVTMPAMAIVAVMALAGFLGGIIAPSRDMLVRKAAPTGAAGRAFGIVSTGFNIGGIVAPLLYASLMDASLPRWVFGLSAMFMLAGVVLALWTDRRQA